LYDNGVNQDLAIKWARLLADDFFIICLQGMGGLPTSLSPCRTLNGSQDLEEPIRNVIFKQHDNQYGGDKNSSGDCGDSRNHEVHIKPSESGSGGLTPG
jgi:hypothetical protein